MRTWDLRRAWWTRCIAAANSLEHEKTTVHGYSTKLNVTPPSTGTGPSSNPSNRDPSQHRQGAGEIDHIGQGVVDPVSDRARKSRRVQDFKRATVTSTASSGNVTRAHLDERPIHQAQQRSAIPKMRASWLPHNCTG